MKKLLFLLTAFLSISICIHGQEKIIWDFTKGLSDETVANLNFDTQNWNSNGTDESGITNNWKNLTKPTTTMPLKANGKVIAETAGLLFDIGSNDYNSIHLAQDKIRLTRKGTIIAFPKLLKGQKVTIVGKASNGTATNRGIVPVQDYLVLTDGAVTNGNCIFVGNQVEGSLGTYSFTWEVQSDNEEPVDVQFQLVPEGGIDFTYFAIDSGEEMDNKAFPSKPTISYTMENQQTTIELTCESEDAVIWYNFENTTDTAKSTKYVHPFVIKMPQNVTAFAVIGGEKWSELSQQRVLVRDPRVVIDIIGHYRAAKWNDKSNGDGIFSWGKIAASAYELGEDEVVIDPETGEEIIVPGRGPKKEPEVRDEPGEEPKWFVKSYGQSLLWQNISALNDKVGTNEGGYYPYMAGDIDPFFPITNYNIQFYKIFPDEEPNGSIESKVKFQAPFDIVVLANMQGGPLVVQVSADGKQWETIGEEISKTGYPHMWKKYTRSYDGDDEVYVRLAQLTGDMSAKVFDIYVAVAGEESQELLEELNQELVISTMQKCATPTIAFTNGKLQFTCETEGVEFVPSISLIDTEIESNDKVDLFSVYRFNVYAKKEGYADSDVATMDIDFNRLNGDMNHDGQISIADATAIVNIILNDITVIDPEQKFYYSVGTEKVTRTNYTTVNNAQFKLEFSEIPEELDLSAISQQQVIILLPEGCIPIIKKGQNIVTTTSVSLGNGYSVYTTTGEINGSECTCTVLK